MRISCLEIDGYTLQLKLLQKHRWLSSLKWRAVYEANADDNRDITIGFLCWQLAKKLQVSTVKIKLMFVSSVATSPHLAIQYSGTGICSYSPYNIKSIFILLMLCTCLVGLVQESCIISGTFTHMHFVKSKFSCFSGSKQSWY